MRARDGQNKQNQGETQEEQAVPEKQGRDGRRRYPMRTNLRKEMTKQGFICEDISSMKEAISRHKGALS
jgi:hypothetical protein